MVTHLCFFCEKIENWPAGAIANRVQLGVQPAFRAAAAASWTMQELIPVLPAAETAGTQLWERWTPTQDALLRRRWAEHVSAARIGAELGFSSGAVMGRAKRMDLRGRHMRRVG